jgi:hypothetical protein
MKHIVFIEMGFENDFLQTEFLLNKQLKYRKLGNLKNPRKLIRFYNNKYEECELNSDKEKKCSELLKSVNLDKLIISVHGKAGDNKNCYSHSRKPIHYKELTSFVDRLFIGKLKTSNIKITLAMCYSAYTTNRSAPLWFADTFAYRFLTEMRRRGWNNLELTVPIHEYYSMHDGHSAILEVINPEYARIQPKYGKIRFILKNNELSVIDKYNNTGLPITNMSFQLP